MAGISSAGVAWIWTALHTRRVAEARRPAGDRWKGAAGIGRRAGPRQPRFGAVWVGHGGCPRAPGQGRTGGPGQEPVAKGRGGTVKPFGIGMTIFNEGSPQARLSAVFMSTLACRRHKRSLCRAVQIQATPAEEIPATAAVTGLVGMG